MNSKKERKKKNPEVVHDEPSRLFRLSSRIRSNTTLLLLAEVRAWVFARVRASRYIRVNKALAIRTIVPIQAPTCILRKRSSPL